MHLNKDIEDGIGSNAVFPNNSTVVVVLVFAGVHQEIQRVVEMEINTIVAWLRPKHIAVVFGQHLRSLRRAPVTDVGVELAVGVVEQPFAEIASDLGPKIVAAVAAIHHMKIHPQLAHRHIFRMFRIGKITLPIGIFYTDWAAHRRLSAHPGCHTQHPAQQDPIPETRG